MIATVRRNIKLLLGFDNVQQKVWQKRNSFIGTEYENGYVFDEKAPSVGIIFDLGHEHALYIQACTELKINYKVIDIRKPDWISVIRESKCQAFLFWPTIYKPIQKQFWDERAYAMKNYLGLKLFPSFDLLWLYESKRKTLDWLVTNSLPHPKTDVFFDPVQARSFIENSTFPIVCKTDQGAAASGVFIVRSKADALKLINKAFKRGILLKNKGLNDRHQGYIIFQEYLADCKEWRIIRVGDSYFCRYKIRVGDFHSGSGSIVWAKAPEHLLDQTKSISEKFDVPNINVDYFETTDGRFLLNEIHALWGGRVLKDEELEGRYVFNNETKSWDFENGDFFRNRCANLRLEWIRENWFR